MRTWQPFWKRVQHEAEQPATPSAYIWNKLTMNTRSKLTDDRIDAMQKESLTPGDAALRAQKARIMRELNGLLFDNPDTDPDVEALAPAFWWRAQTEPLRAGLTMEFANLPYFQSDAFRRHVQAAYPEQYTQWQSLQQNPGGARGCGSGPRCWGSFMIRSSGAKRTASCASSRMEGITKTSAFGRYCNVAA